LANEGVNVVALVTRPPARYSEATLLSAMEGAGKLIDDDELREAMQEKGLGTPATRAAIIEGLIYEKYIHREGRECQGVKREIDIRAGAEHSLRRDRAGGPERGGGVEASDPD
jgi:DNA topoisomerase IA